MLADGTVPTAAATPTAPDLDVVARCVERRFLRMQFPPPTDGAADVTQAFELTPQ